MRADNVGAGAGKRGGSFHPSSLRPHP
ncbi:MAG: hypothetical protein JWM26_2379, partial [Betaproteobacteria bacterium]|nr:hypothetical protein [Betaproteobacteria bacterium]